MAAYYNYSTIRIPTEGADTLIFKPFNGDSKEEKTVENGFFVINTDAWITGDYHVQYMDGTEILKTDRITIRMNLKYAPADFDPRSKAEITLDAIEAMLENRATAQQRRIQVGDKSIEYSSLDELLKWKAYFLRRVRIEQGKPPQPRIEKIIFGRE